MSDIEQRCWQMAFARWGRPVSGRMWTVGGKPSYGTALDRAPVPAGGVRWFVRGAGFKDGGEDLTRCSFRKAVLGWSCGARPESSAADCGDERSKARTVSDPAGNVEAMAKGSEGGRRSAGAG